MTAVTGLVDAVSFLWLGRVFAANMTGNIVLLAFATAHVSGLTIARSLKAGESRPLPAHLAVFELQNVRRGRGFHESDSRHWLPRPVRGRIGV